MNLNEVPMPDPRVFIEVHKQLGMALWCVQPLENELCYWIVLMLKLPASRTAADMQRLLEKEQDKTLGALFAELRKAKTHKSIDGFERRLMAFLEERNWLVHDSWRLHHTDLYDAVKVTKLIYRLDAISREATALRDLFHAISHEWVLSQGITQAQVDAVAREELRRRGVID